MAFEHFDRAAKLYRKALDIQPTYAEANYWLATILLRQGSIDEAIVHLREAVRGDPSLADAHLALGEALERRLDFDGAVKHCSEAARLNPRSADAWFHLGTALCRVGRAGDAEQFLSKAVELAPDSAPYQGTLAAVLYELAAAQEEPAIRTMRRSPRGGPNCAEAAKRPELVDKIEENLRKYERGDTVRPPRGPMP